MTQKENLFPIDFKMSELLKLKYEIEAGKTKQTFRASPVYPFESRQREGIQKWVW